MDDEDVDMVAAEHAEAHVNSEFEVATVLGIEGVRSAAEFGGDRKSTVWWRQEVHFDALIALNLDQRMLTKPLEFSKTTVPGLLPAQQVLVPPAVTPP